LILNNQISEAKFLLPPLPQTTSGFRKVKIIGTALVHVHTAPLESEVPGIFRSYDTHS